MSPISQSETSLQRQGERIRNIQVTNCLPLFMKSV